MRGLLLILIIISSLACVACSYTTDFVVINASESPVEISYKFKDAPDGQPQIRGVPSTTLASRLKSNEKHKWQGLAADRYKSAQQLPSSSDREKSDVYFAD
jgi:hypothetical protein